MTEPHPLRVMREARGWLQAELAQRSGVSEHTISQVEKHWHCPWRQTQRPLLKALGVSYERRNEVFPR